MVLRFLSSRANSAVKKLNVLYYIKAFVSVRGQGGCFHGLFLLSELLDFHAVDVSIHNEYSGILVKSSKPIKTGKATKYLFPRLGVLPVPTLLFVAILLPLESIPTLQFISLGQ